MKQWQQTILDHHPEAIILNETQMKIPSIAWIPETGEGFDHIITRDIQKQLYIVDEYKENTNKLTHAEYEIHDNLYHYLGY